MPKEYYTIRPRFSEETIEQTISFNEYKELLDTKDFILSHILFEECVTLTISCLEDFENFLLSTTQNEFLNTISTFDFFQDKRVEANTKLLSFLNGLTSFRDQAPKLKYRDKNRSFKEDFQRFWKESQEASVAFRFCDRLRNYAQHHTQPVYSVTVGGGWDEERDMCEHHTSIYVMTELICNDRKIPQSERNVYKTEFGRMAEVSLIVREASGHFGRIVRECRKNLLDELSSAYDTYENFLRKVEKEGEKRSGIDAVHYIDGCVVDKFYIFDAFLERSKRLGKRRMLTNNEKHFVSNRPRGHKK